MKLKEIFKNTSVNIFTATSQGSDNELDWDIEPSDFELIPDMEGIFYVRAIDASNPAEVLYTQIITPERVAEQVIRQDENGNPVIESFYEQLNTIIPALGAECFGNYELYYARENPQLGLEVLKKAVSAAKNKSAPAQDMGYILRDENRFSEAIDAFEISAVNGPSSSYIYKELSDLYKASGDISKAQEYLESFNES